MGNGSEIPAVGVIGGSGLYEMDGLEDVREHKVTTPFGEPSDVIIGGMLEGRKVYFLPRHGRGHRILPHELNHQANIFALRDLDVRFIICVTAVGSLQEPYPPCHIVLPDQFYDRTSRRTEHTFFGEGIAAHIGFSDPISAGLRELMAEVATELDVPHTNGGTYVNMDGPAFSTRAESNAYRHFGFDVIGMTNLGEAKLAREAEIALATLAMVTDYDCWKVDEKAVSVEAVVEHLHQNAATAKKLLRHIIPRIPTETTWPEHRALDNALITPREFWPEATIEKLAVILGRFVEA